MKTVKFLKDYQGVKTGERFFYTGQEVELNDRDALGLVDMGAAELVGEIHEPDYVEPQPEPKAAPKKRAPAKRKPTTRRKTATRKAAPKKDKS